MQVGLRLGGLAALARLLGAPRVLLRCLGLRLGAFAVVVGTRVCFVVKWREPTECIARNGVRSGIFSRRAARREKVWGNAAASYTRGGAAYLGRCSMVSGAGPRNWRPRSMVWWWRRRLASALLLPRKQTGHAFCCAGAGVPPLWAGDGVGAVVVLMVVSSFFICPVIVEVDESRFQLEHTKKSMYICISARPPMVVVVSLPLIWRRAPR